MERSSLPIDSAVKPDKFAVNQSQFLNRFTDELPSELSGELSKELSNEQLNEQPNERLNDRSNRFSNQFSIQFPVLNLTPSMMTNEKMGFCADCNNNHIENSLNGKTIGDSNDKIKSNFSGNFNGTFNSKSNSKANPNDGLAPTVKRRRELGNRGYVKKMRKIPFLGIFCAIMYAFFMSTSVALLKIVPNLHPIAVLVYR